MPALSKASSGFTSLRLKKFSFGCKAVSNTPEVLSGDILQGPGLQFRGLYVKNGAGNLKNGIFNKNIISGFFVPQN
jgi:hypothetical protein